MRFQLHILLGLMLFCSLQMKADILTVGQHGVGEYTEIQTAIDSASAGDTVLVYPGIYIESLLIDKELTLGSLNLTTGNPVYIKNTVIDGNHTHRCLYIFETTAVVHGLTIENGRGGIKGFISDISVINCVIQNNHKDWGGGGIDHHGTRLYLSGTAIRNNSAASGGGFFFKYGILLFDSINKCNIYNNHSFEMGTDIHIFSITNGINIVLDTFTVFNPDEYFIKTHPGEKIAIKIEDALINQVSNDVFVSPDGDNNNSGSSPSDPVKNLWYANALIFPDSNLYTIYLDSGVYSPSLTNEKFPIGIRENISIQGLGKHKTILDADTLSQIFYASQLDSVSISNMQLRNGRGSTGSSPFYSGFANVALCRKVHFSNLQFIGGISSLAGAVHIVASQAKFDNVDFIDNMGHLALRISFREYDSSQLIISVKNCRFVGNTYSSPFMIYGGAIYCYSPNYNTKRAYLDIINCEFSGNRSMGSIFHPGLNVVGRVSTNVINCTFADNFPTPIEFANGSSARFYNCILYNDECPKEIWAASISNGVEYDLEMYNTIIQNGIYGIQNQSIIKILYDSLTCFDSIPSWIGYGEFPYYLSASSPAIDRGTTDLPEGVVLPDFDPSGGIRVYGNTIDIGAYEYIGPVNISGPDNSLENTLRVFPNPSSGAMNIQYQLEKAGNVRLTLYDIKGIPQDELVNAKQQAGIHQLKAHFNLDPGIYFITLQSDSQKTETIKFLIH